MPKFNVKNSRNALVFLHDVERHRHCHLTKNLPGTVGTLIRFDLDLLHSLGERSGLAKGRVSCTVFYYVCCYSLLYVASFACLYSLHENARVNEISVENVYNFQPLSLFHGWDKCFFYDLWVSACLKLITFIATLQMTVLCANLTAH